MMSDIAHRCIVTHLGQIFADHAEFLPTNHEDQHLSGDCGDHSGAHASGGATAWSAQPVSA